MECCLLGPEESEVDIRHIETNARDKKNDARLFRIFIGQGQSEFSVVSAARWDEYSRMRARQEDECQELSNVIKYMSEGQGKLLPITRQAVAGSRSCEAEVELRLADVNGRRGTEDTVVAGSGFTRQAGNRCVLKRRNRGQSPVNRGE